MTNVNIRFDTESGANLTSLKVSDLQLLASQWGIQGASKLRKGELVEKISEAQAAAATDGAELPVASDTLTDAAADAPAETQAPVVEAPAVVAEQAQSDAPAEQPAPVVRKRAPRRATTQSAKEAAPISAAGHVNADGATQIPDAPVVAEAPATGTSADEVQATEAPAADAPAQADQQASESGEESAPQRPKKNNRRGRGSKADRAEAEQSSGSDTPAAEAAGADSPESSDSDDSSQEPRQGRGRNRNRNRNNADQAQASDDNGGEKQDRNRGDRNGNDRQSNDRNDRQGNERGDRQAERDDRQSNERNDRNRDAQREQQDEGSRNGRNRYRDRKRRGGTDNADFEPEISDDDVLLPVAGILDVLDNYAFVRTSGYLPGSNDVYVSLGQVKKYNLRKGDAVVGAIRQPRENDTNARQKYNAIVKVDSVNGQTVDEAAARVEFGKLTPLYPQDRLRLETEPGKLTQRIIDLIAPIGKGQRGLIVAPPKAGKTIVLQQIANAISINNPEVHLMVVLVDERPEEVTDMQRTVKGEVIASTFDRPAEDHTTVAELAIERAKRLVELGHDVVLLLDSITRLGRAYNLAAPTSGRILSGGVDASALYPPKRFFGAARNIENGGSLTILATALVETGSKMDEVIFEEFKGTGNSELRLSRQLADKRIFPAVDVNASSTRREEMLLGADEVRVTWKLRRALAGLDQQQALEVVLGKLKETQSNVEFLVQMQKSMPAPVAGSGRTHDERDHR
ncbi:transcription termination factor Rho [Mycetocola manganoxydans]|uniref:Transcription termination factor Rho n=1 Tax=Mycetocola manganoxydans TaxID=699879 RepID=A0A3L7A0G0_9MICO|nr:transcription termination factor Rho [Mycetocola manganoxydans]RLP73776.1 transcription termination factor Rho [Mycetocola manganoxydans]GHD43135.1 transcription termination factor Rho [Mycetocola manganoxydans]